MIGLNSIFQTYSKFDSHPVNHTRGCNKSMSNKWVFNKGVTTSFYMYFSTYLKSVLILPIHFDSM